MKTTILDNGLKVITKNNPNSKICTIGYIIKSGSYHENDDERGMAHVVEHMMFKGTIHRDYKQINQDIESVGGYLNACTSFEYTKYYCTMPKDQWQVGLDVMSDLLFNHTIPEDELKKELEVIKEEIYMYEDDPSSYVFNELNRKMFKKYPNRQPIAGTVESVSKFTRDGILNFIERNYFPENMVLLAVGNINHEEIVDFVNKYIDKLNIQFNSYQIGYEPFVPHKMNGKLYKFKKRDVNQTHLQFGFFGPGYKHEDIVALDLLTTILGGNSSSILYNKIREEKGLAYTVSVGMDVLPDVSLIIGYAGLNNKSNIIPDIEQIIFNIKDQLTEEKLEAAKRYSIGISEMALEGTSDVHNYLTLKIVNDDTKTFEDDMADIEKTTLDDLKRVADKYLNKENLCYVKLN